MIEDERRQIADARLRLRLSSAFDDKMINDMLEMAELLAGRVLFLEQQQELIEKIQGLRTAIEMEF